MAPPATPRLATWGRGMLRLLGPARGRLEFATRLALICALTALAAEFYRLPDPALMVYVVFFLNRPDRATSLVTNLALGVLITLIIGLIMLVSRAVLDLPLWRVVAIALISFGLLFLTSASKLRPVGSIIALIVGFGLDELGLVPGGEIGARGLLYAWLFVATPVAISIIVNLLLAPPPRSMAERALAHRLAVCAAVLHGSDTRAREALSEFLREGAGENPAWLRLAGVERTSRPEDIAALRQATYSTVAIELLVDFATREPEATPPARARETIAALLEDMARILRRGSYPLEVALPLLGGEKALPELGRTLLADLRQALAGFAEPAPGEDAPEPAAKAAGGFLLPDAFTNPEHVQFALKTTGAAMFCYALYTQLNWPSIHTCFITCYIVGLATTAETVQKSTLRILGALIGAAAGIAAIVYLVPHLASIGALMALVFAGALASAWVAVGDPKIAYAGFQAAFAFFLCILQGSAPAFDMVTARDRVIGILIGNLVCYLMFVQVWPVSIARRIDPGLRALIGDLRAMVSAAGVSARRALAAQSLATFGALERDLDLIAYEPQPIRPPANWLDRRRALAQEAADLAAPLLLGADCQPELAATAAARLGELEQAIGEGADLKEAADHAFA
ncbi:MAG: Fusaric acid resistance protein conserved region [Caulobacteraceae bacterium]|nr:Fusaric acid resistance protein conserved region [Caulobacteraceae bacterium]